MLGKLGLGERRDLAAAPRGVAEQAREVARLERSLARAKGELRAIGGVASSVDEPWVALDYEPVEIRMVASAYKRWNSVEKEPFTVAWIERSLRANDVFYDVGANVGAYTLVAAVAAPAARVVAFEPAFDNYTALCRNVILNGVGDRVTVLPVALGAATRLTPLALRALGAGTARHAVGESVPFTPVSTQVVLEFRLDDLAEMFDLPTPTHLKLDVDGGEARVLAGAARILRGDALREVQVEIEPGDDRIVGVLRQYGFDVAEQHGTRAVQNVLFERGR